MRGQIDVTSVRRRLVEGPVSAYQVLGISERATAGEIRKAFRKIAGAAHPDGAAPNAEAYALAVGALGLVGDPEERAAYDTALRERRAREARRAAPKRPRKAAEKTAWDTIGRARAEGVVARDVRSDVSIDEILEIARAATDLLEALARARGSTRGRRRG